MKELKPVHQVRSWRDNGKIFYKCNTCPFLRTVDIFNGEIETVNHGDQEVVHIGGEVRFEFEKQPLNDSAPGQ